MAFSETEQARISKLLAAYCEAEDPLHARNIVRMGFRITGHDVILFEERPAYRAPHECLSILWRSSLSCERAGSGSSSASTETCSGMGITGYPLPGSSTFC